MPYIKQELRDELNTVVDAFAQRIKEMNQNNPEHTRDGLLNYSLTRIFNQVYSDARYHDFNELIGLLECCKLEYYRKYIADYENLKENENGKVDTFNKKDITKY